MQPKGPKGNGRTTHWQSKGGTVVVVLVVLISVVEVAKVWMRASDNLKTFKT